ncbi:unnamed protein product [Darwinula stevensoni]|uniref:DDHD domain-containing protein n=1 Tax=Darwinula stevensoni TaxID=69355 RepID=A0A7R9A4J0_9CRUS|nr:unnamed protein product [Darwinula stevensoni]CAG0883480.1 unnamed protein product [Darwinula stevensoni]
MQASTPSSETMQSPTVIPPSFPNLADGGTDSYSPVQPHWFYSKMVDGNLAWLPFSLMDSMALEEACSSGDTEPDTLVCTDGGRYDVNIFNRTRHAAYWTEDPLPVRRATWFYKGPLESTYTPYDERFANKLEEEYRKALMTGTWHRRLEFPGGESIVIHGPNSIVHFPISLTPTEDFGGAQEGMGRPCTVKRGAEGFNIEDGEPIKIDHLVFFVHGIGAVCDFRLRNITECVDDFRSLSIQLIHSHFHSAVEDDSIGRLELLPISWHTSLHGDATGIDRRLQPITLRSIPKLRSLINDTLLDILFYTSPVYCQQVMDTVGSEINRMYHLFMERNPGFTGQVSLAGHSLGSLILFDLLLHQPSPEKSFMKKGEVMTNTKDQKSEEKDASSKEKQFTSVQELLEHLELMSYIDVFTEEKLDLTALLLCQEEEIERLGLPMGPRKKIISALNEIRASRNEEEKTIACSLTKEEDDEPKPGSTNNTTTSVSYTIGLAGTGQPSINYPVLAFHPLSFFALGSPIAMFVTVRGLENLGRDFRLPTCQYVYNIFHPYDPVAYRLETLLDPSLISLRPVLIPHHKGRKRMHLELKEAMTRVGSDLKTRFVESVRSTWNTIYHFAQFHRGAAAEQESLEAEVDKVLQQELKKHEEQEGEDDTHSQTSDTSTTASQATSLIGQINGGKRIDYVLQEKPIESFNEYLFALGAHVGYWESEDTMLLILKELYASQGIQADTHVHHELQVQSMSSIQPPPPTLPSHFLPPPPVPPPTLPSHFHPSPPAPPPTFPQPSTSFSTPLFPSVPPGPAPYQIPTIAPATSIPVGMDPTAPPERRDVGPPPITGFVSKTKK